MKKVMSLMLSFILLVSLVPEVYASNNDFYCYFTTEETKEKWQDMESWVDSASSVAFSLQKGIDSYMMYLYKDGNLVIDMDMYYDSNDGYEYDDIVDMTDDIIENGSGSYTAKICSIDEDKYMENEAHDYIIDETPLSNTFVYTEPMNTMEPVKNIRMEDGKIVFDHNNYGIKTTYIARFYNEYNGEKIKGGSGTSTHETFINEQKVQRAIERCKEDFERRKKRNEFDISESAESVIRVDIYARAWDINDAKQSEIVSFYPDNIKPDNIEKDEIKVNVNEKRIEFDAQPIIQDGRTLVPMRAIAEALGSYVEWDEASKTAIIQRGLDTAVFQIDRKKVFARDHIELDVAAQVINNRTYIPVRAISEVFGADVQWDGETNTVIITTEAYTDKEVFNDFCKDGFYHFDYFSQNFMEEHMSGGIFNSYTWQSAASNLSDWAKRIVTLRVDNYEEDAYKEKLKLLLSGVTNTMDVNVTQAATDTIAAKLFDGLGKTSDFEVSELTEFLCENADTLDDDEFLSYLAISENAEMLGEAMKDAGTAIQISALTVNEIAFLLTDFSQNIYYLRIIKDIVGEGSDEHLIAAVDSLMTDYTKKYVKIINDVGDTIGGVVADAGIPALLGIVGASAGSLYSISAFAIEQGASLLGAKKYSDNVESVIFLMGIYNNLVYDNYTKMRENIVNNSVSPEATQASWEEFVNSFDLTKACTIEAYKCMKEVTEDSAERVYLEKQIEIASKLKIKPSLPLSGESIFFIED